MTLSLTSTTASVTLDGVTRTAATAGSGTSSPAAQASTGKGFLANLLDVVNPLQHIPIVSDIYQKATGDIPSTSADIAGGALFGGLIGAGIAVANEAVSALTGHTITGNLASAASKLTGVATAGKTPGALPYGPQLYADGTPVQATKPAIVPVSSLSAPSSPIVAANIANYADDSLGLKDKKLLPQKQSDLQQVALDMAG